MFLIGRKFLHLCSHKISDLSYPFCFSQQILDHFSEKSREDDIQMSINRIHTDHLFVYFMIYERNRKAMVVAEIFFVHVKALHFVGYLGIPTAISLFNNLSGFYPQMGRKNVKAEE